MIIIRRNLETGIYSCRGTFQNNDSFLNLMIEHNIDICQITHSSFTVNISEELIVIVKLSFPDVIDASNRN